MLCIMDSCFVSQRSAGHRDLRSFPTRRSSDLPPAPEARYDFRESGRWHCFANPQAPSSMALNCDCGGRVELGACGLAKQCQRRSEEHTSELQSRGHLVCRLLLEKKKHKLPSSI